jgi:hypothetical protein
MSSKFDTWKGAGIISGMASRQQVQKLCPKKQKKTIENGYFGGAQKLMWENLAVVWAEFSTMGKTFVIIKVVIIHVQSPAFFPFALNFARDICFLFANLTTCHENSHA